MKKGFTLIELLIVIGIIAILATTVVLILNPAELLAQTRDTQRMNDMDAITNALALYFSMGGVTTDSPYTSGLSCSYTAAAVALPGSAPAGTCTRSSQSTIPASSWLVGGNVNIINLSGMSGGSPLARVAIDPRNGGTNCYNAATANALACQYAIVWGPSGQFKLYTTIESTKYAVTNDVRANSNDGGTQALYFEKGTNLQLAP